MSWRTRKRPMGLVTRGKTAANRLRRLDVYLAREEATLLRRRDGLWRRAVVVDLGFGRVPGTTLEMHDRLERVAPGVCTVGVEIERERVDSASAEARPGVRFVHGGFDVQLDEPVRMIRAMNVLRQYGEGDVESSWQTMGKGLVDGGLLVEGTCDPFGRNLVVALLHRRGAWLCLDALLFSASPHTMVPSAFPPVLPKRWIHRMTPGEPIHALLESWQISFRRQQARAVLGPRDHWVHAARDLAGTLPVCTRPWLLRHGYLRVPFGLPPLAL